MSKILTNSALLVLGLGAIVGVFFLFQEPTQVKGQAPSGLPSTVRVATTTTVGPQYRTRLFTSNSTCSSRIITTYANPIMLVLSDPTNKDLSSTTVSATVGHLQAASTTVAYDSGLYGCGDWYAYGYTASTSITVTETR